MRRAVVPDALKEAVAATGFSPAVRAGDLLYLTGATGAGADQVMPPDIETQMSNALDKVHAILAQEGAGFEAVVEVTSYHTDIAASFEAVQAAFRDRLSLPLPAWTAVEVAGLRREGAIVELRIVAHVPEGA